MTGHDIQFIAIGMILSGLALVLVGVIGYLMAGNPNIHPVRRRPWIASIPPKAVRACRR